MRTYSNSKYQCHASPKLTLLLAATRSRAAKKPMRRYYLRIHGLYSGLCPEPLITPHPDQKRMRDRFFLNVFSLLTLTC
jgi:hypothetical protein